MLKTRIGTILVMIALAVVFITPAFGQAPESDQPWEFTTTGKVVVIGNVFAEYDQLLDTLASHQLIDQDNNWIGGDTHLVQTGNIFPRDRDWNKLNNERFDHERTARLLMKLDQQARAQGGRVHSLQGILEVLILRWRSSLIPRDVQTLWAGPDSEAKLQTLLDRWNKDIKVKNAIYPEVTQKRLKHEHDNFFKAFYRPGIIEFFERYGSYNAQTHSFDLNTDIARWIRGRNSVIKINDVIYANSGISPVMAGFEPREEGGELHPLTISEMNDLVRSRNDDPTLFFPADADLEGPIWWSGLVQMSVSDINSYMQRIKEQYHAKGMVIGRGQQPHTTHVGDLIFVESGFGSRSRSARINTLEVDGDHWTIFEEDRPIEEGDFSAAAPVILKGGPDSPVKPGGGPPRVKDPGATGG